MSVRGLASFWLSNHILAFSFNSTTLSVETFGVVVVARMVRLRAGHSPPPTYRPTGASWARLNPRSLLQSNEASDHRLLIGDICRLNAGSAGPFARDLMRSGSTGTECSSDFQFNLKTSMGVARISEQGRQQDRHSISPALECGGASWAFRAGLTQ